MSRNGIAVTVEGAPRVWLVSDTRAEALAAIDVAVQSSVGRHKKVALLLYARKGGLETLQAQFLFQISFQAPKNADYYAMGF